MIDCFTDGYIGRSGGGKSTLLSIITRLYPIEKSVGHVSILGENVHNLVMSDVLSYAPQASHDRYIGRYTGHARYAPQASRAVTQRGVTWRGAM